MRKFDSKGITLISLVITIAVLLILASIATYSGVDVIRQSKLNKFTAEMKVMQTQVNDLYQKYKDGTSVTVGSNTYTGDDILNKIGEELPSSASNVFTSGTSGITDSTGYKYYNQNTIQNLGIEGVEGEFYINVSKRSVISTEGLEYDGTTYYTLEQLPNSLYNVAYEDKNTGKPTFDVTTENVGDKNRIIVSNINYDGYIDKWKVKYQLEGQDYWSTSEDLSFLVSEAGLYKVKIVNGNIESDEKKVMISNESWSDEEGVNTPVIKENMQLVKWDESQNKFVEDDTNSSYDYSKQEWANAKVTIDGVESYFVWIPRYEYKITYYTDENKTTTSESPTKYGTIDVKFIPTSQTTATDGYTIHPAFRDGTSTNFANGEWNEELPGIWVGKYESSKSNATASSPGRGTTIKVQPGVQSWRNTTIGDMYTYAKAYSTNLNSHMLKNSEWGAVAYLTHSKYGRNGTEVTINNNSSYITGSAGNSVDARKDVGTTSEYWSEQGVLASSTGNVTGIYDLSGGAREYVAAYLEGNTSSGSSLVSETNKWYVTTYTGTSASSAYKPGDATYETSGWHDDSADFVSSDNSFFLRGGNYSNGSDAGVFSFVNNYGSGSNGYSFRMCLAVK